MKPIDPSQFDDLFDIDEAEHQESLDKWKANKQATYEERVIKQVLKAFDLSGRIEDIKILSKEKIGTPTVNLFWFHELFDYFPLTFFAKSTVYMHEVSLMDLMKRFTKTQLYKAYQDIKSDWPSDMRLNCYGLVFPWPGIGNGIIHPLDLHTPGTKIVREIKDPHNDNAWYLYIEPLAVFLDALSKEWTP